MKPNRLPKELQAKPIENDPQVNTDLTVSRTYDPQQINSLQSLGLIKLDGERFRSYSELGRNVKSLGLIDIIHGGFIVSIDNLLQAIAAAGKVVEGEPYPDGTMPTSKDRAEASKLIGYLSGQLAKVNGAVTKVEQVRFEAAIAVDEKRRKSFQPGHAITIDAATGKSMTSS